MQTVSILKKKENNTMKKRLIALCLVLVLVLSIVGTTLAAGHSHVYVFKTVETYRSTRNGSYVQGCHSCTYAHYHKVPIYNVYAVYECDCGKLYYLHLDTIEGAEYCPYSPNT